MIVFLKVFTRDFLNTTYHIASSLRPPIYVSACMCANDRLWLTVCFLWWIDLKTPKYKHNIIRKQRVFQSHSQSFKYFIQQFVFTQTSQMAAQIPKSINNGNWQSWIKICQLMKEGEERNIFYLIRIPPPDSYTSSSGKNGTETFEILKEWRDIMRHAHTQSTQMIHTHTHTHTHSSTLLTSTTNTPQDDFRCYWQPSSPLWMCDVIKR